jgi:hypothetical protein
MAETVIITEIINDVVISSPGPQGPRGKTILSGTSTQSGFSNSNLYISAVNELNIAQQYSSKQYAFGSIGEGLSATEASNFYTAVQNFQTTLSRQV